MIGYKKAISGASHIMKPIRISCREYGKCSSGTPLIKRRGVIRGGLGGRRPKEKEKKEKERKKRKKRKKEKKKEGNYE